MADTFIPTDPPNQCPSGRQWSTLLQMCANQDDYAQAIRAAMDAGNTTLAHNLREEALNNGAIDPLGGKNLLSALLEGDWGFIIGGMLPLLVGLIGIVLVFLALSSWLNMNEIKIGAVGVPLPKVKG